MANHNDGMCPGFQNRAGVTRWHIGVFRYLSFGIYVGRGRPSRSQVFTLELFRVCEDTPGTRRPGTPGLEAAIFLGLETRPFYTSAVSTLRRFPGCRNGISPRD